jgi:aryl-alcohol dehydrogenase-like predicted oxidoreductase
MNEKRYDRRKFLSSGLAGIGAAGLAGAGRLAGAPKPKPEPLGGGELITRVLGKTGLRVPIVNFGVMNADNPALVRRAYELGMRLYDTAAYYQRGRNEEMVGTVLKEMGVRDQVVIATKVFLPHPQRGIPESEVRDYFMKTAEDSLRRLQTDHIDILHSHNVDSVGYLNHPGILEALRLLKKQGKTRFIGFSTHKGMTECLNDAAGSGIYDAVLTTFNYSFHDDPDLKPALERAAAAGIGLIAMKTQCHSDWYEQAMPPRLQAFYRPPLVHPALLKWALRHEFIACAVPGVTTFEQMDENFVCARSLDLSPEEKKFLEDRGVRMAMASVCRRCDACVATCPRGADVPELLRAQMYAFSYGNLLQARDTLDAIPASRGIGACGDCGACVAVCANRVDIGRRIARLREAFA